MDSLRSRLSASYDDTNISYFFLIRLIGWEIEDCDGTACGGEVCRNDGVCSLKDESGVDPKGYSCECAPPYAGDQCKV